MRKGMKKIERERELIFVPVLISCNQLIYKGLSEGFRKVMSGRRVLG